MKLLFVQLPVQDPSWESSRANVPLAAGYLAAWAEKLGLLSREDWTILPSQVVDYASDRGLIEAITEAAPDLVAFSIYLWNLERSLHIATEIAKELPRARLIAGGPEIVEGMPIFERSPFHSLVEGEGEPAFATLLGDLKRGKPLE